MLSRAIFPRGVGSSPEPLSFVSARPVGPAGSVSREVCAPDPTYVVRPFGVTRIGQDPRPVRPTPPRHVSDGSRPGAAPPELSLPGEPCPLSRVVASVRVRSPSFVRRGVPGCFTIAFPAAPAREPGRRFLAVASPVASTHPKVRHTYRPLPVNAGLAVYERHARFEALLPPGVRSVRPSPWQARASRPVLSWGCRPPELSPRTTPGPVSRAGARAGLDTPATHVSGRPASRGCRPRTEHRLGVHEPRVRRRAPSQNRYALPSSCRPCPLSAAPRASLPFTSRSPAKGFATLDLEDAGLGIVSADSVFFGVVGTRPSTGADRWWALLSPGGPALVGFRPSSSARRVGP